MRFKLLTFKLESNKFFNPRTAEKIRGYFGNLYTKDILFHHHLGDGKLYYRYPFIQYKIIDGEPLIIGIKDGVDSLKKSFLEVDRLVIDKKEFEIFEKSIILEEIEFGVSKKIFKYKFITPWYALNQNNYKKYLELDSIESKRELLKSILTGNILVISKSIGITITERIEVKKLYFKEFKFNLDDNRILGFVGNFSVNFQLPDYIGLGKSVSRGFGTIKRIV
ncbi:hypothetical protein DRQ09_09015 [candidate division KSB1 bacterium]|nr:MAG: hypothetical protein DRQ09_09015 [candidate division KSB1 bacterium]